MVHDRLIELEYLQRKSTLVQMVCMKQLNKMINVFYKVQTPQARRLIALIFNEGWGIPATGASNGMAGGAD